MTEPGSCILFEAVGDERRFMVPMLKMLKERQGVRLVALVRFTQDKKPYAEMGLFDAVYSTAEMLDDLPPDDDALMPSARDVEKRFDTVFHYNLCDRRLYFTGCTNFPYTRVETGESYTGWVRQFLAMYRGIEAIFERHEVTLALNGRRVVCDVARGLDIPARCLGYSFLHDRMIWKDGQKVNGEWLAAVHERARRENRRVSADILEPPPFHMTVRRNFFAGIRISALLKTTVYILLRTVYWHLRRYDKVTRFGYSASRHIRFQLNRRRIYRYLVRRGTSGAELLGSGKPFVFMALQMEPEVLLSSQTPEFYDQIAMIHQVAKELPVGTYLAIKDHVPALGYRDLNFYRMLDTMPNVILIDPSEFAIPLIRRARAVVSLLGRSAFEAAAFGIPVLTYSPSPFFGYLPHIEVCTDMARVRPALEKLLSFTQEDRRSFVREGEFMLSAMESSTLDPAEFVDGEALGAALLSNLNDTLRGELAIPSNAGIANAS